MCTILRQSPMDVSRILCDNGLDSWTIKRDEESTLAKIAILYQLANGCVEYSTEFRRMCKLLEAHVDNLNLETPNLVKSIEVALKQFPDSMFTDAVNSAKDTPYKFARIVNHVAKEMVGLYSYLGPKA